LTREGRKDSLLALSLPYELRRLAAFKADVLTALGRVFIDVVFASYRRRARRRGIADGQCGAINFVQRFGSMNLNVHFHVVVLDGVFTRGPDAGVRFHALPPPAREELDTSVRRTRDRAVIWLRRHGHLDGRPIDERSQVTNGQTALDACAAIAIGRGQVNTLPNVDSVPHDADDTAPRNRLVLEEDLLDRLDRRGLAPLRPACSVRPVRRLLDAPRLCRHGVPPPSRRPGSRTWGEPFAARPPRWLPGTARQCPVSRSTIHAQIQKLLHGAMPLLHPVTYI